MQLGEMKIPQLCLPPVLKRYGGLLPHLQQLAFFLLCVPEFASRCAQVGQRLLLR
jgi:hypothetical protein